MTASHTDSRSFSHRMEQLSATVSEWTGSAGAFLLALAVVVVWLLSGPVFHFSDTWQLVINTSTTVVTFLMVFLIQRAQNKAARAMSLKLDELVAVTGGASNRLIDADRMSEAELMTLHRHFQELASMAKRESTLTKSHSIEEARARHEGKKGREGSARGRRA